MHQAQQKIKTVLDAATRLLAPTSPTAHLDAAVLLAHSLGWSRSHLLAEGETLLDDQQQTAFQALVRRRLALEPVAYLIGQREFYGLEFLVDQRVLVPRPDTETLVERSLAWLTTQQRPVVVADVGTGSGCIAVALAVHHQAARLYALDISPAALAVAISNIQRHSVAVIPLLSDGCAALPEPVDLIVSNPPYTLLAEIDQGVLRHEPWLALDGGDDGLAAYRWLLPQASQALRSTAPGAVIMEIGAWQAADVSILARASFPQATITVWPDLAGRDRVIEILQPGPPA